MGLMMVQGIDSGNTVAGADVPYEPVKGKLIPYGRTAGRIVSGYPIGDGFGMRKHPIYGDWRPHGGADIGVPSGTMFAVKAKSKVVFAGADLNSGYGNVVEIFIPEISKMMRFAHLSSVSVRTGQEVEPGTVLGKAGSTGLSTGPHFHIEVHSDYRMGSDHPHYGHEDPAPSLGYVILGDKIQQRSEGSVERIGRIMVGEAGTEFVVPLSQMPIFGHLMMEEKIKCLIPEYKQPFNRFINLGFDRLSGSANDQYGSGAIIPAERALLLTIAKAEGTTQGYGTIYGGAVIPELDKGQMTVKEVYDMAMTGMVRGRQAPYEPGSYATGRYQFMPDTLSDIVKSGDLKWDEKFTHEAQDRAILSRLDHFRGVTEERLKKQGLSDSVIHDLSWEFASFPGPDGFSRYTLNGRKQPAKSVATIRKIYNEILPTLITKPKPEEKPKPQVQKPKPKTKPTNLVEAIWDFGIKKGLEDASDTFSKFFNQLKPKKRSSLNNIPGHEQMKIASQSQDQFSFDNAKGDIIMLYKPTVYYPEPT
jgi:murein DD-endopeptidase MepM/ murein hydrolase activator NlpD